MRSTRLPSAPPRIRLSASANSICALCLRNSQTIHSDATMAMLLNSQRCIPPASCRKLNAAPVLCASTRSNTPRTRRLSPKTKWSVIHALLSWSSTMTSALKPSQRLSIAPLLTAAEQVAHATAADGRMIGIAADVGAVMPAALAFVVQARGDVDVLPGFRRHAMHRGARGDEHETQVIAEARQHIIIIARHIHIDLGRQCRADQPGGARLFKLLVHPGAPGSDLQPCGKRLAIQLRLGQAIPFFDKNAVILPAAQHLPRLFCRKAEYRRHQTHHAVRDVIQRILRGAARGGVPP